MIVVLRSNCEAIECALAIQRSFRGFNERQNLAEIRVRVGIHTGEALLEEERIFGVVVNTAVRICAECDGSEVLVSENVHVGAGHATVTFQALGKRMLRGLSEPVDLYRVVEMSQHAASYGSG
jgi:adenylate cyclase